MSARRRLALILGAAGFSVYLWAALRAPVVQWSDSQIDLAWARSGAGIFRPVWSPVHAAKPGYLLFLRTALAATGGSLRGIVVLQSLLLFAAIAVSAALLARRTGFGAGLAFWIAAMLFLRIRDAASSIMSEALAASLFLPITALVVAPPRRTRVFAAAGALVGALFVVRPNLGATALVLFAVTSAIERRWTGIAVAAAVAASIVAPFWIATAPGPSGDRTRGLTYQIFEASADDYWMPSIGAAPDQGGPAEISRALAERAAENWRKTLQGSGPDTRRQLFWRALHGLLGIEFYDARWSEPYRLATSAVRVLSPIVVLAAFAILFVSLFSRWPSPAAVAGLLVTAALVAQDVLLGANARYVLPFLPALLLFGIVAAPGAFAGWRRTAFAVVLFLLTAAGIRSQKSVLGWEWGLVESAGVTLEQEIPRRALPDSAPAVLHVRIAAAMVPASAGLKVTDSNARLLYASAEDPSRSRPEISIPLPQDLLDENRRAPIRLRLAATGQYGPTQYLLFPVIPRPWSAPARRVGAPALSPATGIVSGSLDWWAHSGFR